jgi:hypothetical protein
MAFAIAHIRGGGEMGRPWYEDEGKYLTKKNTFRWEGQVGGAGRWMGHAGGLGRWVG